MSIHTEHEGHSAAEQYARATDAELVAATRAGQNAAYAELWRRHANVGLGIARRATHSFDPEDLLAEAYANILEAIGKGQGPTGPFRPYLSTVVRNVATRWARAIQESTVDDVGELLDRVASIDNRNELDNRMLLIGAFQSLAPRWQEILWLTEVNGLKPREVARQLGLSPNSVSALASRAREGLRQAWIEAHLKSHANEPECARTILALPSMSRDTLPEAQQARVNDHLNRCASCRKVWDEARDVASRLHTAVVPVLLGLTTSASLASGFAGTAGGSAGAGAAAASAHSNGVLSLFASTKAVLISGAVGLTAAATVASIAIAPMLLPPPVPQSAPEPGSSTPLPAHPTAGPVSSAPGDLPANEPAYSDEELQWITPATRVQPQGPTDSEAAASMQAPKYAFEPGSTLSASAPSLSGEAIPSATVTVVLAGGATSHRVFSTTANSAGGWDIPLVDIPNGNYSAWAYQESEQKRSDARATEFVLDRTATVAPRITEAQTGNQKFSPTVSGTGQPGTIVYVMLNGVTNESAVSAQGTWQVMTTRGAVIGTNTIVAVQYDTKTMVLSEVSPPVNVDLVSPSVQVSGAAPSIRLTVAAEPGASVELASPNGKFSHLIKYSTGVDEVSLRTTGSANTSAPSFAVMSRYVSPDGVHVGPWSEVAR
ncbi:RNA polymerase sigma factor [Lysinibacter cavernae]|uniref:RNA polymerase sigma factor (Sigma-70 family) n=1 Tax=Lysinibacter cavernae TaxID=1640652 RepID=A0A7X5TTY8_9MICO|nr:sigma-70 family RNA polymerase sigma factor [Lysinibacter cavernae]NIH54024.1 RNA polymerase sigma factor (sigma-70 family) [Lysinibacter cavernae]